MEYQPLTDLMHSIRNKTLIADILIKRNDHDLIPTVVEEILQDAQTAVDDFCVREK